MKTANVKAVIDFPSRNRCLIHIYSQRAAGEKWNLGNSSLLLNHDKLAIVNPELVFQRVKYSTKNYKPIRMVNMFQNKTIAFQIELINDNVSGKLANTNWEKILTVQFDLKNHNLDLNWRSLDTALVDDHKLPINTRYTIE